MFSKRWSTFSLLTLAALVAVFAFKAGRRSTVPARISAARLAATAVRPESPSNSATPAAPAAAAAPVQTNDPEARWAELTARPATPAGESEEAAWIEKLAERDPQRAVALAAGQANLRLRAALLRAALKGWGRTNPEAAVDWAETQPVMDQAQAVNALLQGAVENPKNAISVATSLIQKHPERASEFGTDLISALTESGQFARAADFAATSTANCRDDWMLSAYSRWAEFQPQAAVAAAQQISDPDLRETALNAVIVGWSPNDPKGLVDFTQNHLPAGLQNSAVASAIGFWADSDPVGAATWINQNNPGAASDPGVAKIALSPQLSQQPEIAVGWAESIASPDLRMETLVSILKSWTATDPSVADNFIDYSPAIPVDERSAFRASVSAPVAP